MKAIPTKYNGRQYRSRLEARWAAMFDLLGWKYEYEPFDLDGWIPDFIILGKYPIIVEVKPILKPDEFPEEDRLKIQKALRQSPIKYSEVMILGTTIFKGDYANSETSIGWFGYNGYFEENGEWKQFDKLDIWDEIVLIYTSDKNDFSANHAGWGGRITGEYFKNCEGWDYRQAEKLWNEAGNKVQWKKPPKTISTDQFQSANMKFLKKYLKTYWRITDNGKNPKKWK